MRLKAKVGEQLKLNALLRGGYAGMISSTIFSITLPNTGNYYYPTSLEVVNLFGREFKIIKVDESEIELEEM